FPGVWHYCRESYLLPRPNPTPVVAQYLPSCSIPKNYRAWHSKLQYRIAGPNPTAWMPSRPWPVHGPKRNCPDPGAYTPRRDLLPYHSFQYPFALMPQRISPETHRYIPPKIHRHSLLP